ncbi:hypothetical protein PS647_01725 [Pseudomonas fluorescens]|uniref:hypothetical protein n=1 Tax=Pseudomonas fluorescens TaxID=294 RepID=UPI0012406D2C|nr:hypothetical protein [Pseudomonas fluorescens]VVM55937.1 hypothetical protein PS647_01034 [Pseudomonas fluorescens]VVM69669.1 hypothetical protein PS647_01725 [Pseudomonas fluorescens]
MKAHELSKALLALSKILKAGPDIDIEDWSLLSKSAPTTKSSNLKESDIPAALYTLVKLNDVSKSQWLSLMSEYDIDIEIRPRDANRDIVGKILNYLAANPIARENLLRTGSKKNVSESAELANALNLLLK